MFENETITFRNIAAWAGTRVGLTGRQDAETRREAAFERLIRESGEKVYNSVRCMMGNDQDAEETVQEIFLQAYVSLPRFKGRSSLSTWLYRIAMNVTIDRLKAERRIDRRTDDLPFDERAQLGGLPPAEGNPESAFLEKEAGQTIEDALMGLPVHYRTVFVLKEIEGRPYREISKILDISIGTVESRLFRARQALKKELSGRLPYENRENEDL